MKLPMEFLNQKYEEAEKLSDWTLLKPYPYLLFRWQIKYEKDKFPIAKYASCKLGKHKWCTDKHAIEEEDVYYNASGDKLPF